MRKAIQHLIAADPVMADIIERVGPYKIMYREPTFENLARSIVYQQLSGKAAGTIFGRVVEAAGGQITPESILGLSFEQLRSLGLSKQKAAYVLDLAGRTARAELMFDKLLEMEDEHVLEHLTQVKGVGVWTVQMFLMFAMRRPNVLPVGDLGIQNAVKKAYRLRRKVTPKDVARIGKRWDPYCSVATWYLWRSLELPKES